MTYQCASFHYKNRANWTDWAIDLNPYLFAFTIKSPIGHSSINFRASTIIVIVEILLITFPKKKKIQILENPIFIRAAITNDILIIRDHHLLLRPLKKKKNHRNMEFLGFLRGRNDKWRPLKNRSAISCCDPDKSEILINM